MTLSNIGAAILLAIPAAAQPLAPVPADQAPPPPPIEEIMLPETSMAEDSVPDELVEAQRDVYRRMTVPVTIGGEGPFRFMIDTGAQATVITRGLTEKLGMEPSGSAIVVGMGSRKPVPLFEVDGFSFASREMNNLTMPMLEARNIGADGILGVDSLQDLRVLIDFRNDTIAVNDADNLGGNRGYEIVVRARYRLGRLIIAQADIDGVRTSVVIDTGAQSSFGNRKLERRLRARRTEQVVSTDVNGVQVSGNRHVARSLTIQGLQLNNLGITFADSPAFEALGLGKRPALILGMRDLGLFDRVAIDFSSRRILFDVPKGTGTYGLVRQKYLPSRLDL